MLAFLEFFFLIVQCSLIYFSPNRGQSSSCAAEEANELNEVYWLMPVCLAAAHWLLVRQVGNICLCQWLLMWLLQSWIRGSRWLYLSWPHTKAPGLLSISVKIQTQMPQNKQKHKKSSFLGNTCPIFITFHKKKKYRAIGVMSDSLPFFALKTSTLEFHEVIQTLQWLFHHSWLWQL